MLGLKMFIVLTRWSVNARNPKVPSYCLPLDLIQRPLPPQYNYTQSTVTVRETPGTHVRLVLRCNLERRGELRSIKLCC